MASVCGGSVIFDALVAAYFVRDGWRVLLAAIAIAIGVASAVAADLGAQNAERAARAGLAALGSDAQIVVDAPGRGLSRTTAAAIAATPGVVAVRPLDARAGVAAGVPVRFVALDALQPYPGSGPLRAFGPGPFSAPGSVDAALVARRGALVSNEFARRARLAVGSPLLVRAAGVAIALRVAAILAVVPATLDPQSIVVDLATARASLPGTERFDRIDVVAEPGRVAAVRRALAAALGTRARVSLAAERVAGFALDARAFAADLQLLAALALAAGTLVTIDAVSQSVRARRTQIATLRMLGATRAAIARTFVLEALLVGIAGATLGVLAGAVLTTRSSGPHVEDVALGDALLGLRDGALGVALVGLAALIPAHAAASVAPAVGLRAPGGGRILRSRRIAAGAASALALAGGAAASSGPPASLARVSLAAASVACVLLAPLAYALIGRIGAIAGRPLAARLAAARLAARATRASLAAAALSLAVAASVCAATLSGSFGAALSAEASRAFPGDLTVLSAPGIAAPLDPAQLRGRLLRIAGVESIRAASGPDGRAALSVFAVPGAPLASLRGALVRASRPSAVEVESTRAFREAAERAFARSRAALGVVRLASLAVALFATAASFAALVVENRRDLRLVRLAGLTAAALRWSVAFEAAVVAGVAASLGSGLGLWAGTLAIDLVDRRGLGWPLPLVLATPFAAAVVLGTAALAAGAAALAAAPIGRPASGGFATFAAVALALATVASPVRAAATAPAARVWTLSARVRERAGPRRYACTLTIATYAFDERDRLETGALSILDESSMVPLDARQAIRSPDGAPSRGDRPWRIVSLGASRERARFGVSAAAPGSGLSLRLRLNATKGPVAIPEFGGRSYTRLTAVGTLSAVGRRVAVEGTAWLDESDDAVALRALCGVERLEFAFADGRELETIARRRCDGRFAVRSAGGTTVALAPTTEPGEGVRIPAVAYLVERDGANARLPDGEIDLFHHGDTFWHSPHDRASYPALWVEDVAGLGVGAIGVEPRRRDQEIGTGSEGAPAWFGAVRLFEADPPGRALGDGFVELTGFASPP